MVAGPNVVLLVVLTLALNPPADPVLERLDPPRRAAVVMALVAIAITGLLLVACAMLGANWVRRVAREKPRNGRSNGGRKTDDNRQLRQSLNEMLPPGHPQDTIHFEGHRDETKVDP
jgi:hypothetical protein